MLVGRGCPTIRSIGISMVSPRPRAIVLHLGHGFETGKAANKHCDTTLDHAPQCKPGDLGVNALGVGDYDTSDGDADDEYAQAHHGEQPKFLLGGHFYACDNRDWERDYCGCVSIEEILCRSLDSLKRSVMMSIAVLTRRLIKDNRAFSGAEHAPAKVSTDRRIECVYTHR